MAYASVVPDEKEESSQLLDPGEVRVNVKTLDKTFTAVVNLASSVLDFKNELINGELREDASNKRLRLIFGGKLLEDSKV